MAQSSTYFEYIFYIVPPEKVGRLVSQEVANASSFAGAELQRTLSRVACGKW